MVRITRGLERSRPGIARWGKVSCFVAGAFACTSIGLIGTYIASDMLSTMSMFDRISTVFWVFWGIVSIIALKLFGRVGDPWIDYMFVKAELDEDYIWDDEANKDTAFELEIDGREAEDD